MWILAKGIAALLGFFIRLFAKYTGPWLRQYKKQEEGGSTWYLRQSKTKGGSIVSTTIAVPSTVRSVFKLTPEGRLDRWFKSWGLASEVQSGDRSFDERVYTACDSPAFHKRISTDAPTRHVILALFTAGAKKILSDGTLVWATFDGDPIGRPELRNLLFDLTKSLANAERTHYSFLTDRFVVRALLAEALVWTLAGYALTGGAEWFLDKDPVFLDFTPVVWSGILVGFIGAALVFILIAVFMHGSSRGHRILIESGMILGLCLPLGGMNLISDLDRGFDSSAAEVVTRKLGSAYARKHRGRRGRTYYTYHLYLQPGPELQSIPSTLPLHLEVSRQFYEKAYKARFLRIEVAPGFLHIPWYRSLTPEGTYEK